MPLSIPNTTTTDSYLGASFAGTDVFESGYFTVANASVAVQLLHGSHGQAVPGPELFLPPGTYPVRGTQRDPVAGIQFRSFVTGTPAQVFGVFFYPTEASIQAGTPFDATVSASGVVTGGGAGSMQLISDQLLSVAAAEISFANIPATYAHLRLLIHARGDAPAVGATTCVAQFNGDTAANYDYEIFAASGAAPVAVEQIAITTIRLGGIPGALSPANVGGSIVTDIPNYATSTLQKSLWSGSAYKTANAAGGVAVESDSGQWRSTAAINRIRLFPGSGSFVAGSRFTLYGIAV